MSLWRCEADLVYLAVHLAPLLLLLGLFSCVEKSNNPLNIDDDGDGFSEFDGDCNDSNPKAYPGAAELDSTELCMVDNDEDGYGWMMAG